MLINIENSSRPASAFALWSLGFRPFFLAAGIFAIVSIALWMAIYIFGLPFPMTTVSISKWHAHEMIYGYSLAVIAGFLLTAVRNWTNIPTVNGSPLMVLVALWAAARAAMLCGDRYINIAAVFDILFLLALMVAVALPIIKVRQWRQLGILVKLALLTAGNICFYMGAAGMLTQGIYWGVYGGLLLIIGLILTIGRRVIPFFIERGVGYPVKLYNASWLDISSMVFFLGLFIAEVFYSQSRSVAALAGAMFVITSIRLYGWHTPGIWKKPLLWSLFASLLFIDLGFLLIAMASVFDVSSLLAIHAFSVGGVGVITLGMMSRVALGHTGRDINSTPFAVTIACATLILAAVCRVILPLLAGMAHYTFWIVISQALWIIAFTLFVITYLPILIRPRPDGKPG